MNYDDMSDFDINILVALRLGYSTQSTFDTGKIGFTREFHADYPNTVWASKDDHSPKEQFNFTADPADAWPIILEKKMIVSGGGWAAVDEVCQFHDKNPLRAAMIVYLMMSEDKA
jgi:hypothetical protein